MKKMSPREQIKSLRSKNSVIKTKKFINAT